MNPTKGGGAEVHTFPGLRCWWQGHVTWGQDFSGADDNEVLLDGGVSKMWLKYGVVQSDGVGYITDKAQANLRGSLCKSNQVLMEAPR